jgi:flagellar assembly factor FliW
MQVETTRFGTIDFPDGDVIHFDKGLIGFYDEHDFVVVPHGQSEVIAWLQSTKTGALAFPVVSAHVFSGYPDVALPGTVPADASPAEPNHALMVILSAQAGHPATVNLLAPLVVDTQSRRGTQVILENTRFSARELFVLPRRDLGEEQATSDTRTEVSGAGA